MAAASGYLSCLHDTDTSYTHKSVKGTVKGCMIPFKLGYNEESGNNLIVDWDSAVLAILIRHYMYSIKYLLVDILFLCNKYIRSSEPY